MKTLLLLASVLMAGCVTVPPTYDSNQYLMFVKVETNAQFLNIQCDNPTYIRKHLPRMQYDAALLVNYTEHLPLQHDIIGIATILQDEIDELRVRYETSDPSSTYCKLKTRILANQATIAVDQLGELRRIP